MRVTSELFASALVRQSFSDGRFAAVTRKGAAEAGAVFVVADRLDGTLDLFAPAPQSLVAETDGGRVFEKVLDRAGREEVEQKLAAEARMDPDFWVVEIETQTGDVGLSLAKDDDAVSEADAFFKQ